MQLSIEQEAFSRSQSFKRTKPAHPVDYGDYVAAFYNDLRGAFNATRDAFDWDTVPEDSASYFEYPILSDAVWTTVTVNSKVDAQKIEPIETTLGYSLTYNMGFILIDLRGLGKIGQMNKKPTEEQYKALKEYMETAKSMHSRGDSSPKDKRVILSDFGDKGEASSLLVKSYRWFKSGLRKFLPGA